MITRLALAAKFIHCLKPFDNKPLNTLQNLSIKSTAWNFFCFLSKKKLMVEIFSGSHKP